MADRLDEQLHETCSGIFSHSISLSALARRLSLVPGEMCVHTGTNALTKILHQMPDKYSQVLLNFLTVSNPLLGHPGGCRCCHRCNDVAEWGHVWPGSLELCHAPC